METKKNTEKTYTANEVKDLLSIFADRDTLTLYSAEDVKDIFKLGSIDSAYRLMKNPAFPSMKIGKHLRVTKRNLIKFIEANDTGSIELS